MCIQRIEAKTEDQSPRFSAKFSPYTKIAFGATSGAGTYFRPWVSMTPRPVEAYYSSRDGDTRGPLLLRVQRREALDQNSQVANAVCWGLLCVYLSVNLHTVWAEPGDTSLETVCDFLRTSLNELSAMLAIRRFSCYFRVVEMIVACGHGFNSQWVYELGE